MSHDVASTPSTLSVLSTPSSPPGEPCTVPSSSASAALPSVTVPPCQPLRATISAALAAVPGPEPFYLVHLPAVVSQFQRWSANLPAIKVHYAIKCNPDRGILQTLASLGANFDCASETELREVLSIVGDPTRIIFANPVKSPSQLKFAASVGVRRMTADCVPELEKIRKFHPTAQVLIRLKPDDSKSLSPFSSKFGASLADAQEMVAFARNNGVALIGCAFHVGSNCQSATAYRDSITDCAEVFRFAKSLGVNMTVLDIGGGFPGLGSNGSGDSFETMAKVINAAVEEQLGGWPDLEVIGEPGRYFAAGSMTLVCSVIGKKTVVVDGKRAFKYYLDEGIYGGFNCINFDHFTFGVELFTPRPKAALYNSTVFGPTCDSIDTLGTIQLPELFVDDRLFCPNFGAYTASVASSFNGFINTKRIYLQIE